MGVVYCDAACAGIVELQERSQDKEERAKLLAAKQRRPSARSYLDWEAGPDTVSDSSSSEGVSCPSLEAQAIGVSYLTHAHHKLYAGTVLQT